MPEKNGIEASKEILQIDGRTRIIFLSADVSVEKEAISTGAFLFLTKLFTIDELIDIIANIAGKTVTKKHDLSKPQGVRGRNSDNSKLKEALDWAPKISLEEGLIPTYEWIQEELRKTGRL